MPCNAIYTTDNDDNSASVMKCKRQVWMWQYRPLMLHLTFCTVLLSNGIHLMPFTISFVINTPPLPIRDIRWC